MTASCGAEYEWGVPDDSCWTDADRLLIRLCDSLHENCTVDDALWAELARHHCDEALLELLMLASTYRTISYLVNSLRLPPESGARRFPLSHYVRLTGTGRGAGAPRSLFPQLRAIIRHYGRHGRRSELAPGFGCRRRR